MPKTLFSSSHKYKAISNLLTNKYTIKTQKQNKAIKSNNIYNKVKKAKAAD